jgi:hypothetical protein
MTRPTPGLLAVIGMFLSMAVVVLLISSAVFQSYDLFKCMGIAVLLLLWDMFELGAHPDLKRKGYD